MNQVILGVDVASRLGNTGVAKGVLSDSGLVVELAFRGGSDGLPGRPTEPAAPAVAQWLASIINQTSSPVLIALDAPLGWPQSLSDGLANHQAGGEILTPDGPNRLWRRLTDQDIHARFGKLPLEVGANYIARAAWTALEILRLTRILAEQPISVPLAPQTNGITAIETYPAATLRAWLGKSPGKYKSTAPDLRAQLLTTLSPHLQIEPDATAAATKSDHVFDAVACVLAGADFQLNRCPEVAPHNQAIARREGWIHTRQSGS